MEKSVIYVPHATWNSFRLKKKVRVTEHYKYTTELECRLKGKKK